MNLLSREVQRSLSKQQVKRNCNNDRTERRARWGTQDVLKKRNRGILETLEPALYDAVNTETAQAIHNTGEEANEPRRGTKKKRKEILPL